LGHRPAPKTVASAIATTTTTASTAKDLGAKTLVNRKERDR